MGWGNAIDKLSGILDGLLGLSPEQRKRKLRDKIDELETKRSQIIIQHPNIDNSRKLLAINSQLDELRKKLQNS